MKSARILPLLLSGALLGLSPASGAHSHHHHGRGTGKVAVSELPPQARATLRLIGRGGQFPYARDGVVFNNHERKLPSQPRGYYHEYTVKTPHVQGRGPRRIVCGPPPECYYSKDHYRSFRRIIGSW